MAQNLQPPNPIIPSLPQPMGGSVAFIFSHVSNRNSSPPFVPLSLSQPRKKLPHADSFTFPISCLSLVCFLALPRLPLLFLSRHIVHERSCTLSHSNRSRSLSQPLLHIRIADARPLLAPNLHNLSFSLTQTTESICTPLLMSHEIELATVSLFLPRARHLPICRHWFVFLSPFLRLSLLLCRHRAIYVDPVHRHNLYCDVEPVQPYHSLSL